MSTPLISVIIPAYKDGERLRRALLTLRELRTSEYPGLELIAAVKPSPDDTEEVARRLADRVVAGGRASEGRNKGIEVATGQYLLFHDADLVVRAGLLRKLVEAASNGPAIVTSSETPLQRNWRAHLANAGRNLIRGLGIVKGLSAFMLVDAALVKEHHLRFDPDAEPGDIFPFYLDAMKAGARYGYVWMRGGGYAIDHRRYNRDGYLRTMWFWIRFGLAVRLGGQDPVTFAKQYWAA